MAHPDSSPAPTTPARTSATALAASAPLAQAALVALGLLDAARQWLDFGPRSAASTLLAVIVQVGGFALAGWLVGKLLTALAGLLECQAAGADTAARRVAAADRIAEALERLPAHPAPAVVAPPPGAPAGALAAPADGRTMAIAEIRVAQRQGEWNKAGLLFQTFSENYPDDPVSQGLGEELKAAKAAAVASLRDRLDAARDANDPDRVLELREPLAALLEPEALTGFNRSLAKWFMAMIQKRMRQGAMTKDIAVLAGRVAGALDTTPEGASLRAALPTLRRSVGLCARCGQAYTGIADACPSCLASSSFAPYLVPPATPGANGGPSRVAQVLPPDTSAPEPE